MNWPGRRQCRPRTSRISKRNTVTQCSDKWGQSRLLQAIISRIAEKGAGSLGEPTASETDVRLRFRNRPSTQLKHVVGVHPDGDRLIRFNCRLVGPLCNLLERGLIQSGISASFQE